MVATGVLPRTVTIPGGDANPEGTLPNPAHTAPTPGALPRIVDYRHAFADISSIGERVAIIGAGGIAVDLAHLLVEGDAGARFGEPAPLPDCRRARPLPRGARVGRRAAWPHRRRRCGRSP